MITMVLTYVLDDKGEMIILIDQFCFTYPQSESKGAKVRLKYLMLSGMQQKLPYKNLFPKK